MTACEVHHSRSTRPARGRSVQRRGFTLIELMLVIGIVFLLSGLGTMNFIRYQEQSRTRSAVRHFMSIVSEARNAALLLGSANGTGRVLLDSASIPRSCPVEFEAVAGGSGRAALSINPTTNQLLYVSQVIRNPDNPDAVPAEFVIRCKTADFNREYRNSIQFEVTDPSVPSAGISRFIPFDGRGFVEGMGPNGFTVGLRELTSNAAVTNILHTVLVLASGITCHQGPTAGRCAES